MNRTWRRSLNIAPESRFFNNNRMRWAVVVFIGLYMLSSSVCLAQDTQGSNDVKNIDEHREKVGKQNAGDSTIWGAFWNSVVMILATEIGDKTFFLAALMAMQSHRVLVFLGAITSLAIMTVLSAIMGLMLPSLLPRSWMQFAGSVLFLCFGVKMIIEGLNAGDGPSEELIEVEQELLITNKKMKSEDSVYESSGVTDLEAGVEDITQVHSKENWQIENMFFQFVDRQKCVIFSTAFSMTLLAEWGDRSQIATIALAAQQSAWGVTLGAIIGHIICTSIAVIGGRLLASRISERNVHLIGGVLFLMFAAQSCISVFHSM